MVDTGPDSRSAGAGFLKGPYFTKTKHCAMTRSFLSIFLLSCLMTAAAIGTDQFESAPLAVPGEGICASAQLIYSLNNKPTPQCHASTIAETPGGLVAAWFAGTKEKHPDVGIRVAIFNGREWSEPVEVANGIQSNDLRYPCWNPVLFQPKSGPLMLFYKVGPSPSRWWGMLMTSEDYGETWTKPKKLGKDQKLGEQNSHLAGPVKNKPVQLPDGAILCPSSSEHDGWRIHFISSVCSVAVVWSAAINAATTENFPSASFHNRAREIAPCSYERRTSLTVNHLSRDETNLYWQ